MRSRRPETHTCFQPEGLYARHSGYDIFASCRIGVQIFAFYFQAASKNASNPGMMTYWAEKTLRRWTYILNEPKRTGNLHAGTLFFLYAIFITLRKHTAVGQRIQRLLLHAISAENVRWTEIACSLWTGSSYKRITPHRLGSWQNSFLFSSELL